MRHPTAQAINKFNELLNINEDQYNQDWEHECADFIRVEEFIVCYHKNANTDDEKFTLMGLILSSFEGYHEKYPKEPKVWEELKSILLSEEELHQDHIEYYSCLDTEIEEEWFPITLLIRNLKNTK